jgi:hypothetical protein
MTIGLDLTAGAASGSLSPADYRASKNTAWQGQLVAGSPVGKEHWSERVLDEVYKRQEKQNCSSQQGTKYDQGKAPISLVDPQFIEGVAQVLAFGANKYNADNWRGGIAYRRLIDAAYRHIGAINRGEDIDDESGLPHVYHASCCLMFLSWMTTNRKDLDDRYKY